MSIPTESDAEQHDPEPMGSYSPPFLPTESLVHDVENIAPPDLTVPEDTRNRQLLLFLLDSG